MNRIEPDRKVVVAMSYDPVDVLSDFAAEHGITYPLLSDAGSATIRELGLENRVAAAQNAHFGLDTDDRHVGMPHPGTFHIDANGIVTAKQFEQSHRVRPSASVLLRDELALAPLERSSTATAHGIEVEFGVPSGLYHPKQIQEARLRIAMPKDQHVYVGDVPRGFTSLNVVLDGPPSMMEVELPEFSGHPFRFEGLDHDFEVVDGFVDVGLRFRIDEDEGDATIATTIAFQSCTRRECFPPISLTLEVSMSSGGLLRRH